MKLVFAILISFYMLLPTGILYKTTHTLSKELTPKIDKSLEFEKEVLPALVKNCSPCHFTGGKMYERLPFDKETTIITNGEKILKRIGNDEKKAAIREFILQQQERARK
jgi:hypothetical protein